MIHIIPSTPVFKGISYKATEEILSNTYSQVRTYRSGTLIYQNGDKCENLLTVLEGSVRGEMTDISGKVIKIEDVKAPQHIAAAFLFGANNRFPVNVIANTDVKILFIPKLSFVELLQNNKTILNNYLNIISNRAHFLSNKIKFLSFKTIKSKIANYIIDLSKEQNSSTIVIPQTQKDLADYFGVTRPSLARIIGELESEEVIVAKGKKIEIVDKEGLIELLS